MQFQLPENLQVELLAYDPKLKQLARTTDAKIKSKKPKFPLGQPYGFVPEDAIKTSLVQDAIDLINAEPVERRHHEFKRITGFGPDAKSSTVSILYHYESVWYAAWLPPKGKEQDYVYGFAIAYKDNKTSKGMLPYVVSQINDTQVVPYGRSNFITYSRVVTKEDIITKLKAKLGDYLSDIGQEIRKDPDLINKLAAKPAGNQMGPPVKTVTTDDGHQIQIHGNEDDGFRISIKNRQTPSQFSNLDEAVMACEMYCARRRTQALNADYVEEA